jgi:hypothetical protein
MATAILLPAARWQVLHGPDAQEAAVEKAAGKGRRERE